MNTQELDTKIIEALQRSSTTTRGVCNRIFLVEVFKPRGYIVPGAEKMKWVYRRLTQLKKKGIIKGEGGYWQLVQIPDAGCSYDPVQGWIIHK